MSLIFYRSTELRRPLSIKLCYLEGAVKQSPLSEVVENPSKSLSVSGSRSPVSLSATVQIFCESTPLAPPVSTTYKNPGKSHKWYEWVELPVFVSNLPLASKAVITLWGPSGQLEPEMLGSSTLDLFNAEDNTLKQGSQKLDLVLKQPMDSKSPAPELDAELDRLERRIKDHQAGKLKKSDWLDGLAFRKIEALNTELSLLNGQRQLLFVELPIYEHVVIFDELRYDLARPPVFSETQQLSTPVAPLEDPPAPEPRVYDPEIGHETPIESKYRRLVRTAGDDRNIRPTASVRDRIMQIIAYSPVHELMGDEKNLLWKYRYYLTRQKRSLTKFVKSASWDDPKEAEEAVKVLNMWSDVDVADALELLGHDVANPKVRAYAVDRLRKASDRDLELYLLQLVEALKFEPTRPDPTKGYLARFLIQRAALNPLLGNFFYWYVSVQSTDRKFGYKLYQPILMHYLKTLSRVPHGDQQQQQVKNQVRLINKLLKLAKIVKESKEPRPKREQLAREYVADAKHELVSFVPTVLPLQADIKVTGCIPEETAVFKSSMMPLKLVFKTTAGTEYPLIFKTGDDLRQDQLVIQVIQLMDRLLRDENLNLRLTPYRIIATGPTDGAVQFIPNEPLSRILAQHHGILPFFRKYSADDSQPLGVRAEVMDNYVRSTAGYAVITYLLGVGDRHLDNLLLDTNGHFFHIDFGYILGKDPKAYPPMIKLPIQLIDGMGGINSENYTKFCSFCFTAFTTLRKSSNLILALLNLMTESSIPDIMTERGHAVRKVEERFCLHLSEEEAILHFQNLITDSVNAFLPMVIDRLHSMAQYWRA